MYNRAAGIEILNYVITRLGNWRGAGGMRQRYGAENPDGDTARKIRAAIRRGKSGRRYGAENPGGDKVRKIRAAIRRGKSGRR